MSQPRYSLGLVIPEFYVPKPKEEAKVVSHVKGKKNQKVESREAMIGSRL